MPFYLTENIENIGTFAIWKLTENEEDLLQLRPLSEQENNVFSALKNSKRRKEWLTNRILVEYLAGKDFLIDYLPNGKPLLLKPKWFLSVSHSENFVVVFVSKNRKIGIDIEKNRENIGLLKHKFLLPEELQSINDTDNQSLHVFWGAKEAMYKMYNSYSPLFTEHLTVSRIDYQKGTAIGNIQKGDFNKTINIFFRQVENNTLVCCFSRQKTLINNLFQ